MIELCQHACTIYPASVPVTDLLSIRSYRQGLESCSYCYRLCTHGAQLSMTTEKFSLHMVFCATPFTALTTTALMKEVSFLQFQSSAPSYLLAHCPVYIDTFNSLCISVEVHNFTFSCCVPDLFVWICHQQILPTPVFHTVYSACEKLVLADWQMSFTNFHSWSHKVVVWGW